MCRFSSALTRLSCFARNALREMDAVTFRPKHMWKRPFLQYLYPERVGMLDQKYCLNSFLHIDLTQALFAQEAHGVVCLPGRAVCNPARKRSATRTAIPKHRRKPHVCTMSAINLQEQLFEEVCTLWPDASLLSQVLDREPKPV